MSARALIGIEILITADYRDSLFFGLIAAFYRKEQEGTRKEPGHQFSAISSGLVPISLTENG
jgi:hypothetical protein